MRANRMQQIDNARIDLMYDLEPVFEPSAHAALETWADLDCPYCGESSRLSVDLTDQSRSFIEDCEVCCQPIQVSILVDATGILRHLSTRRMDD